MVYLNFNCSTDQDCYDFFYPEPDADTWWCDTEINKCVSRRNDDYLEPYRNTKVYFAPVEVSDPDPDDTIESVGWEQILNDPNYMTYQILDPNPTDVLDGVSVVIRFLVDSPETGYGLGKYLFRAFASDGFAKGYDDLEVKVLNRVPKADNWMVIDDQRILCYCIDNEPGGGQMCGNERAPPKGSNWNYDCTMTYDPDGGDVDLDGDSVKDTIFGGVIGFKVMYLFGSDTSPTGNCHDPVIAPSSPDDPNLQCIYYEWWNGKAPKGCETADTDGELDGYLNGVFIYNKGCYYVYVYDANGGISFCGTFFDPY